MDGVKDSAHGKKRKQKNNDMDKLYRLEHNHRTNGYEQNIYIGLFSSKEKVEEVIDHLISKPGFKLHPRNCFNIIEIALNNFRWKKGFIQVDNNDIEL